MSEVVFDYVESRLPFITTTHSAPPLLAFSHHNCEALLPRFHTDIFIHPLIFASCANKTKYTALMSFDRPLHEENLKHAHPTPQVAAPRDVDVVFIEPIIPPTTLLQWEPDVQSLSIQPIEKCARRATQPIFTVQLSPNTPHLPDSINFESETDYVIRCPPRHGRSPGNLEHDSTPITFQLKLKVLDVYRVVLISRWH